MIDPNLSDEWLMRHAGEGSREHLAALMRRHAAGVLTFLRRMIADETHCEDLFQEVFLALWVHRGRYIFPKEFRPWLFGIAANKCKEHLRRQANRQGANHQPAKTDFSLTGDNAEGESPATRSTATDAPAPTSRQAEREKACHRVYPGGTIDEVASAAPSPSETLIAAESRTQITEAVAALPERQRMVVSLRMWGDMSYAEIARAIGGTEVTARSLMFHALAALRQRLERLK